MKYKLLKDLPLAKAGTEVTTSDSFYYMKQELDIHLPDNSGRPHCIAQIKINDVPEWLEEVKEHKTIYDLKEGDEYWDANGKKITISVFTLFGASETANINMFLTEREAKRNKLLRELATRTDKWLPEESELYLTCHREKSTEWAWADDNLDILYYHQGLVFRNQEEYNKYITQEAKDLLFNI